MSKEQEILKQAITQKLAENKPLTDSEEYFYLTQMLEVSAEEAERVMTIAEQSDKFTLID